MVNITQNKEKILENLKEHVITFLPYEQFNSMWIMGDFTNWEPKEMTRSKDIFSYKTVLIRGWRYFYSFTAKDQVMIDYNAEYENNPRSHQPNNFIDVKKEYSRSGNSEIYGENSEIYGENSGNSGNLSSPPFDYKLHYNLLEGNKRIFTKARMGDEREVLILEKALDFSNNYGERIKILTDRREDIISKINKFYE